MIPKKRRAKTRKSLVWEAFDLIDYDGTEYTHCLSCNVKMKYTSSTTAMIQHLKRRHPEKFNEIYKPDIKIPNIILPENLSHRPIFDMPQMIPPSEHFLPKYQPKISLIPPKKVKGKYKKRKKYNKEENGDKSSIIGNPSELTKAKLHNITNAITCFFAKEMIPLECLESESFMRLMEVLEPNYQIPETGRIQAGMKGLVDDISQNIIRELQFVYGISYSFEIWKSLKKKTYLTLGVEYIDFQFLPKSYLLQTIEICPENPLTSISTCLKVIFNKYHLQPERRFLNFGITDQGENIEQIIDILNWPQIISFPQVLNKIMERGLGIEEVVNLRLKCTKFINHFELSEGSMEALKTCQVDLELAPPKMKSEINSEWNSVYKMFKAITDNREALNKLKLNYALNYPDTEITEHNWRVLEELSQFMKPFDDIIKMICANICPLASLILPVIFTIQNKVLQANPNDHVIIRDIKKEIEEELNVSKKQYEKSQKFLCFASYVDLRFKKLNFLSEEERTVIINELYQLAKTFREYQLDNGIGNNEEWLQHPVKANGGDKSNGFTSKMESIFGGMYKENNESQGNNEFMNYHYENCIQITDNPLEWWKSNQRRYPFLSQLARILLSAGGTNRLPMEVFFKHKGQYQLICKSQLSSKELNNTTFLSYSLQQ